MRSTLNSALLLSGCFILFGLINPQYSLGKAWLDKKGNGDCTFQLPDIAWKFPGPEHMRQHVLSLQITHNGVPVYRRWAQRGDESHHCTYQFRSGRYRVVARWSSPEGIDSCNVTMP